MYWFIQIFSKYQQINYIQPKFAQNLEINLKILILPSFSLDINLEANFLISDHRAFDLSSSLSLSSPSMIVLVST